MGGWSICMSNYLYPVPETILKRRQLRYGIKEKNLKATFSPHEGNVRIGVTGLLSLKRKSPRQVAKVQQRLLSSFVSPDCLNTNVHAALIWLSPSRPSYLKAHRNVRVLCDVRSSKSERGLLIGRTIGALHRPIRSRPHKTLIAHYKNVTDTLKTRLKTRGLISPVISQIKHTQTAR